MMLLLLGNNGQLGWGKGRAVSVRDIDCLGRDSPRLNVADQAVVGKTFVDGSTD
ncbi:MAG: hypothetical protein ABIJ44_07615 [Pseudomonadota bacterium]